MASPPQRHDPRSLQLGAVILAAGLSRRAAPHNKLLLPGRDGAPVIRVVANAVCEAGVGEPIVVTGHQREEIEAALAGLAVRFVHAADHASGLGHSLAAGIRAVPRECDGFLICPGDLPGMTAGVVREIAASFVANYAVKNIIPICGDTRGHPVVLVAALRAPLEALAGDHGAKMILATAAERARSILLPVASDAIHADNDQG